MGSFFSSLYSNFLFKNFNSILMVGLESAGKTAILYKLNPKGPQHFFVEWFMLEYLNYENFYFTALDLGQNIPYPYKFFWNYYHSHRRTDGIIYIIDSNNKVMVEEYDLDEIKKILTVEELKNCPILFLANKQDLKTALSPVQIKDILELKKIDGKNWNIKGCSALTGEGIKEGLDWIKSILNKNINKNCI